MSRMSDLVSDSQLVAKIHDNVTTYSSPEIDDAGHRYSREEIWRTERLLGRGGFGQIWLQKCVTEGLKRDTLQAVKIIHKQASLSDIDFERELEAIAKFSKDRYKRWFVKSHGWYESPTSIFISMEYCYYGDFGRFLKANGTVSEVVAQHLTYQILEGLDQMHQQDFAHRDLKPGNILIKSMPPKGKWWLVLSDFGFSKRAGASANISTGIRGTDTYMAPELLQFLPEHRPMTISDFKAADIWALGDITFELITGTAAFPGPVELIEYCRGQQPSPSERLPDYVSAMVHDYIKGNMSVFPQDRRTSTGCLNHDWMKTRSMIKGNSAKYNEHNLSTTKITLLAEPVSARWSGLSSRVSDHSTGHAPSTRHGSQFNSSVTQVVASSASETTTAGAQAATQLANGPSSINQNPSKSFNMTLVKSFELDVKYTTVSPDGKVLAFHNRVSMVIMDVSSGIMKTKFKTPKYYKLNFSPDSQYLVAEHRGWPVSWLAVYSGVSGTTVFAAKKSKLTSAFASIMRCVVIPHTISSIFAISPDSTLLAWGWDTTITVMQLSTGKILKKFEDAERYGPPVDTLAFSPDGKWLVVTAGGLLKACDITSFHETYNLWRTFAGGFYHHGSSFRTQISFSRTGGYLAVSSSSIYMDSLPDSLSIWNFTTGESVREFTKTEGDAISRHTTTYPWKQLVWSPRDGQMIALSDKAVIVGDVSTSKVERTIDISLGLSKMGELIISPAMNLLGIVTAKEIQLWDIERWELVRTIDRGTEYWRSAWFAADGQRLLVQRLHKLEVWKIDRG